jgi:hypothetical protein
MDEVEGEIFFALESLERDLLWPASPAHRAKRVFSKEARRGRADNCSVRQRQSGRDVVGASKAQRCDAMR